MAEAPEQAAVSETDLPIVPQPIEAELGSEEFSKFNRDLDIEGFASGLAFERDSEMRVSPEQSQAKLDAGEPLIDFENELRIHQATTGLTPLEYKEAAKRQGIDLNNLYNEIVQRGRASHEVVEELRQQKVAALIKTPEEREVTARGALIKEVGVRRLEEADKPVPTELKMGKTYDYRIETPDAGDVEEEAAVVKPGSKTYQDLDAIYQSIFDPETGSGQVYIAALEEANGNMFNESGLQLFQERVANYEMTRWVAKQQAAGFDYTELDNEYTQERTRQTQKALRVAAMAHTVNRWTAPMWISWDKVTGLEQPDDSDDLWVQRAWRRGSRVRLELIGVDAKHTPVYRVTSPVWHIFEMSDALQSAVVGSLDRVIRGPEGESIVDTLSEGSLEGIENRRHMLEWAMSSEMAKDSTAGAWTMGLTGLVGTVAFPDLLVGAAGASRLFRKIADGTSKATKAGRLLHKTIDDLAEAVKDESKAAETMARVRSAVDEGDYDLAEREMVSAIEMMKRGEQVERDLRKSADYAAQGIDATSQQIYLRQRKNVPYIAQKEGRELADQIPGAFGHHEKNMHPSVRKGVLRAGGPQQLGGFQDFYNHSADIESLLESLQMIRRGEAKFTGMLSHRVVGPRRDDLVESLDRIGLSRPRLLDNEEQASKVTAFTDYFDGYEGVRTLVRDPAAWSAEVRRLADDLPLTAKQKNSWLGKASPTDGSRSGGIIGDAIRKTRADAVAFAKTRKELLPDNATMFKAIGRAAHAVETNIEARAAAMAIVREAISDSRGLKAKPIMVKATNKHREVKELSPIATLYKDQIKAAFGSTEDEAIAAARLLDMLAGRWAAKTKRTADEYFLETFPQEAFKDKAAFMRRIYGGEDGPPGVPDVPPNLTGAVAKAQKDVESAQKSLDDVLEKAKKAEEVPESTAVVSARKKLDEAVEARRVAEQAVTDARVARDTASQAVTDARKSLSQISRRGAAPAPTPTPVKAWQSSMRHPAAQAETALPEGYQLVGVGDEVVTAVADLERTKKRFGQALNEFGDEIGDDANELLTQLSMEGLEGSRPFSVKGLQLVFSQEKFDEIINSEVFKGEPKLVKLLDDMVEEKLLLKFPLQWKVINDIGDTIVGAGFKVLDVVEAAVKKLIDDGVIVRSADDIEIGHPIRVGPIIHGMSIDAVDAAIGTGYTFEWGAHWIDGQMVFRKKGKARKVPVSNQERFVLARADKVSFTHNHPNFSWFSASNGDMAYTASMGIDEFRVVWPDGTMIKLEAPNGWGDIAYEAKRARGESASIEPYLAWRKGLGSYVAGPSTKVARRAYREARAAGRRFTQRDYAVAYTEEANKRLVDHGRRVGVDLRISVRQPEEGAKAGLRRTRPAPERLAGDVESARKVVDEAAKVRDEANKALRKANVVAKRASKQADGAEASFRAAQESAPKPVGVPEATVSRAQDKLNQANGNLEAAESAVAAFLAKARELRPEGTRRATAEQDILFQAIDGKNPIYYSKLAHVVENRFPRKMDINAVVKFLSGVTEQVPHPRAGEPRFYLKDAVDKKTGKVLFRAGDPLVNKKGEQLVEPAVISQRVVKAEEIEWTNIEQFLEDAAAQGKKSVTKEEVLDHLKNSRVVVDEVSSGLVHPAVKAARVVEDKIYLDEVVPLIEKVTKDLTMKHQVPFDGTEIHRIQSNPDMVNDLVWDARATRALDTAANPFLDLAVSHLDEFQRKVRAVYDAVAGGSATQKVLDQLPKLRDELKAYASSPAVLDEVRKAKKIIDAAPVGDIPVKGGYPLDALEHYLGDADAWADHPRAALIAAAGAVYRFENRMKAMRAMDVLAEVPEVNRIVAQARESPAWSKWLAARDDVGELSMTHESTPTRHGNWTLPGGDNYREVLITLPRSQEPSDAFLAWHKMGLDEAVRHTGVEPELFEWGALRPDQRSDRLRLYRNETGQSPYRRGDSFTHDHWPDVDNVLVHFRAKNRVDDQGRKILFIEEAQSDQHQAGRKRGYSVEQNTAILKKTSRELHESRIARTEAHDAITGLAGEIYAQGSIGSYTRAVYDAAVRRHDIAEKAHHAAMRGPVPDAPFKDTKAWAALAVKRIMRMAADEGFDGVAFTSGQGAHVASRMPIESAKEFYDVVLPSVIKKHTKAPLGKTTFRSLEPQLSAGQIARGQTVPEADKPLFNFVELTPEVKKQVGGPQFLFQRTAPRQTGWEMKELADGSVELTSAEIRAARQVGEAPAALTKLPEAEDVLPAFKGREVKTVDDFEPEELWHRVGQDNEYSELTFDPRGRHPGGSLAPGRDTGFASGMYAYRTPQKGTVPVTPPSNPLKIARWENRWRHTETVTTAVTFQSHTARPMLTLAFAVRDLPPDDQVRVLETLRALGKAHEANNFRAALRLNEQIGELLPVWESRGGFGGIQTTVENHLEGLRSPIPGAFRRGNAGGLYVDAIEAWLKHGEVHPVNILLSKMGYDGIEWVGPALERGNTGIWGMVKFPPTNAEGKLVGVRPHGDMFVTSRAPKAAAEEAPAALTKGESYFDPERLSHLKKQVQAYGERESLIYMSPDEFLSLARPLTRVDEIKAETVAGVLDRGEKFADIPFLDMLESGEIRGHEGRHRAMALKKLGVEKMPVRLMSKIRWNEQLPGKVGDWYYVENLPKQLVGQDGTTRVKAPYYTEGPNRGRVLPEYLGAPAEEVMGAGLTFKVEGDVLRVQTAELPEALQGQGIGQEMYLRAMEHAKSIGKGFESDIAPSPEAIAMYERLIEQGVPLTRKTVEAADGKMVQQFVMEADELRQADLDVARRAPGEAPTDPRILKQEVDDELRGATEFLEDGRAVIYALNKPSFATFVHEIGHVMRRDLDEKQMDTVVKWLNETEGVSVTAKGARFEGTAEAVVEAEEKVARAFEDYIRTGETPQPKLKKIFQQMKDWLVDFYGSIRGLDVTVTPEIRKVFDDMIGNEPPRRPILSGILKLIKDELTGEALKKKGVRVNLMNEIARESRKLGRDISVDDLIKQFDDAAAADATARGVPRKDGQGSITLPGPIYMAGRYPEGKTEFSSAELGELLENLVTRVRLSKGPGPRMALKARAQAIQEMTPTQIIDNWVASGGGDGMRQWVRNIFLGGDAFSDMRNIPEEIRHASVAMSKTIEQTVGDTIHLVGEGDLETVTKYLTGELVNFRDSGRSTLSSGHDMMGSVVLQLRRFFDPSQGPMTSAELQALTDFAESIHVHGTAVEYAKNAEKVALVTSALQKMTSKSSASPFIAEVMKAAGVRPGSQLLPNIFGKPGKEGQPGGLIESLMYVAGVSRRPPEGLRRAVTPQDLEKFEPVSRMGTAEIFTQLYKDLRSKQLFQGDPKVANRIVVLIAGHGAAAKAMKVWADLGIVVDPQSATSFKKWVAGEALPTDADMARVLQLYQIHGFSPNFVQGMDLYGMNMYIPRAARERLASALARATDPSVAKGLQGDFLEAIGSGMAVSDSKSAISLAWGYRYLKTRMVRGHYVLKSRYFTMNTYDHFNQMALITGFRPALASTVRMIPQNALSNPLGQAIVLSARTLGWKGAGEDIRKILQTAGDKGAHFASRILMGSKWRMDLNSVLEGTARMYRLGPNVVSGKHIRDVALQEGIFSSFDTSQLGIKIQKSLDMFIARTGETNPAALERVKEAISAPYRVAADIAEAWSERERLGAMMTLMEMGLDARTAARVTIDALYDYAGSMSKFDRHWLINMVLPFWAFQKNVNRQVVDAVFSPKGAYRLGVMRRAYDHGTTLISDMLYSDMVDEYGIDVENMPESHQSVYYNFKDDLEQYYADRGEEVPDEVHREIARWVSSVRATNSLEDGLKYTPEEIRRKMLKLGNIRISDFYIPKPRMEARRGFRRIRPGFAIPHEYTENARKFIEGIRSNTPDTPYTFVMLPEPAYHAAFHHMAYAAASMILSAKDVIEGPATLFTEDDGTEPLTDAFATSAEIFAPQRAPLISELLASYGLEKASYPQRLHPNLADMARAHGVDVFETTLVEDPYATEAERQEAREKGREAVESVGIIREKRYYMAPGVARLLFVNNPIGELNTIMMKRTKSPLEEAAKQGDMIMWARAYVGLDVEEVYPSRTVKSEMRRAREEGGAERVYEKARKGRKKRP